MTIKYQVNYYESERGWGNDSWSTLYETEQEAVKAATETNEKYCSSSITPDYYIKATYVGPVEV